MQIKLLAVFAFVLFVLVGLNVYIAYINIKSGDKYARQVLSQEYYDSRTIPYRRGEIRDRNGNVLARSEKVYNVILDCYAVNEDQENYMEPTVRALAEYFNLDEAEMRSLITAEDTKESRYQILVQEISQEEKDAFEEGTDSSAEGLSDAEKEERSNVQGVWFEEDYQRIYPMDTLASSVVGFSNDLNDGIAGLEAYYSDVLNGVNGREYGYLNEDSELERNIIEPENGNNLVTSIDMNIQQIVEKYIAQFDAEHAGGPVEEANGKGSVNTAVIVSNPNTGEIYAMATNHGYDLNDPYDMSGSYTQAEQDAMTEQEKSDALNELWNNFCVSDSFEPGSTFKPITVASALETGAIDENDTFYCDGGEMVTDRYIRCDNVNGHGMLTVKEAIQNSCNDCLMQISFQLGIEQFCEYIRLFNFGSLTGIDLPNENTGVLYTRDAMHEVELATNSFGQTFTCTMVQELAAFSTVVSGGYYYQPQMVKQVLSENGGVVKSFEPVLQREPISSKTSEILKEALEMGVQYGTSRQAQVPGYRVGGKTGTAEKGYPRNQTDYIVSFIGAVPINDPEVVIYVVIDQPNVENQADSGLACVLARQILMEVLPYMNIPMTEEITDEQLATLGITREEAEAGRITETEAPETDEYGNVIETETEASATEETPSTDEYGNVLSTEETPSTDEYGNVLVTEETEDGNIGANPDDPVAENPNVPAPPDENQEEQLPADSEVTMEDLITQ